MDYQFNRRAKAKWVAGRRERGLSPLDPFQGDPCAEGREECLDLANYIDQAIKDGRIPEQVGDQIIQQVYGIDMILGVYAGG